MKIGSISNSFQLGNTKLEWSWEGKESSKEDNTDENNSWNNKLKFKSGFDFGLLIDFSAMSCDGADQNANNDTECNYN